MFAPHQAQIGLERAEPVGLDVGRATKAVERRNALIAHAFVMKTVLRRQPLDVEAARRRIMKAWESDARIKTLASFIESWNRWRHYYSGEREFHTTWIPKAGNITLCEQITDLAAEEGLDLDLLIACGHRAHEKRSYGMSPNLLAAHALQYYTEQAERVRIDMDEDEATFSASDEWGEDF